MHIREAILALALLAPSAAAGAPARGAPATMPAAPDPADFVAAVDHPWFPLTPGTTLHYRGETAEGREDETVEVTDRTRVILGVTTVVVHDRVERGGETIEDTWDWYAQDRRGNVWYFGEDTHTFEHGRPTGTAGSWTAGEHGARPGLAMPAAPRVGQRYEQEHRPGVAEDHARVMALHARADVPAGRFADCLETEEWSPLEPTVRERKRYARGVGLVWSRAVAGEHEAFALVRVDRP